MHDAMPNIMYSMKLINARGQLVFDKSYIASSSFINEHIQTQNLPAGIYVIQITSPVNNHSQKIMIR